MAGRIAGKSDLHLSQHCLLLARLSKPKRNRFHAGRAPMAFDSQAEYVRRIVREYAQDLDISQEDHELAQEVLVRARTGERIRESAESLGELLTRIILAPEPEIVRVSHVFASIEVRVHPRFEKSRPRRPRGKIVEFAEGPRSDREARIHERMRVAAEAEYFQLLEDLETGRKSADEPIVKEQIKEFEVLRLSWGIKLGKKSISLAS